jgi:hypothetical protein
MLAFGDMDMPEINSAKFPHRLDVGDEVSVYIRRHHVVKGLKDNGENWIHVLASASTARTRTSRSVRVDLSD